MILTSLLRSRPLPPIRLLLALPIARFSLIDQHPRTTSCPGPRPPMSSAESLGPIGRTCFLLGQALSQYLVNQAPLEVRHPTTTPSQWHLEATPTILMPKAADLLSCSTPPVIQSTRDLSFLGRRSMGRLPRHPKQAWECTRSSPSRATIPDPTMGLTAMRQPVPCPI